MLSPPTWIFDLAIVMIRVGEGEEKEQGLFCFKAYGY